MWRRIAASAVLATLVTGCDGAGTTWGWPWGRQESVHGESAPGQSASPGPVSAAAAPGSDRVQIAHLEFDVYRLDLPVAPERHALKLWNHVDELRADTEHLILLARNGLRVGVAPEGALPALRTLIESVDARMTQGRQAVRTGAPLIIKIAAIDAPQEYFCFDRSGAASGGTLRDGDKAIVFDYEWRQPSRLRTTLSVGPAVVPPESSAAWDPLSGAQPQPAFVVFQDLVSSLSVEAGQFVVIGAGKETEKDYLLGNRFLTYRAGGTLWETILMICPRASHAPSTATP